VYLEPFDSLTWFILISILAITSFIVSATAVLIFDENFTHRILSFCFYIISIIFDNNTGKLCPSSRGNMSQTGKFVFLILVMVCLMIGNIYKGIITRDIISPLPNRILYDKISDLSGFLFGVLPNRNVLATQALALEKIVNASRIYGDYIKYPKAAFDFDLIFSTFGEELANLFIIGPLIDSTDRSWVDKPYADYYNRTFILPSPQKVFQFLRDCSEKRAFIGFQNEIEEFMKYGNAKEVFAFGKDNFLPVEYFWQIPYAVGGYLHRRMGSIICSGIGGMWESIYYSKTRNELDLSLKVTLERAQTLQSNLGALFMLHILGLGVASAVFLFELLISSNWANRILEEWKGRFFIAIRSKRYIKKAIKCRPVQVPTTDKILNYYDKLSQDKNVVVCW
jgi:hypothetical protein